MGQFIEEFSKRIKKPVAKNISGFQLNFDVIDLSDAAIKDAAEHALGATNTGMQGSTFWTTHFGVDGTNEDLDWVALDGIPVSAI